MSSVSGARISLALLFAGVTLLGQTSTSYRVRAECGTAAETLSEVPKDAPLKVHFSIAGNQTCYAVSGEVNGKPVRGYVSGRGLDAVEGFERERAQSRQAAFQVPPLPPSPPPPQRKVADATPAAPSDGAQKEKTPARPSKPMPVHID
jgi:hypothetical protein